MDRYLGSLNSEAVEAYCNLAKECGLTPSQLALSWCCHRELVASTIIGSTSIEQLEEDLNAFDTLMEDAVHEKIKEIYKKYTDPTKTK
jgi:aryl-alcohol dehydrogenase-like predicted oxidoreductase